MNDTPDAISTRPYLIRALYEWCTDNGFTPHLAVSVNESVQVPYEFVQNGEIVLNIGMDATSSLKLGNDFIEFKARFSGTAREIMVPVGQVMAIYARENGQGMSFPLLPPTSSPLKVSTVPVKGSGAKPVSAPEPGSKQVQLSRVGTSKKGAEPEGGPPYPSTQPNARRPALKRVK